MMKKEKKLDGLWQRYDAVCKGESTIIITSHIHSSLNQHKSHEYNYKCYMLTSTTTPHTISKNRHSFT